MGIPKIHPVANLHTFPFVSENVWIFIEITKEKSGNRKNNYLRFFEVKILWSKTKNSNPKKPVNT